uniref:Secreted protein n=1 Tax=Strongyloides stercoralis TaxID=6248 RepID=A0A0K0EA91_STRER
MGIVQLWILRSLNKGVPATDKNVLVSPVISSTTILPSTNLSNTNVSALDIAATSQISSLGIYIPKFWNQGNSS